MCGAYDGAVEGEDALAQEEMREGEGGWLERGEFGSRGDNI